MSVMTLKPTMESVAEVTEFVENILCDADASMKVIAQMNIAVDEIMSNIAQYSGASSAEIACEVVDGKVTLTFVDDGVQYDPTANEDPDVTLSAEERKIGGLGIFMVKKSMDEVVYVYRDGKNVLTLTKTL